MDKFEEYFWDGFVICVMLGKLLMLVLILPLVSVFVVIGWIVDKLGSIIFKIMFKEAE